MIIKGVLMDNGTRNIIVIAIVIVVVLFALRACDQIKVTSKGNDRKSEVKVEIVKPERR